MSAPPAEPRAAQSGELDRSRTYIQVLVIEVLVITSLYFLGRYFG